jgi:hypothetical protein
MFDDLVFFVFTEQKLNELPGGGDHRGLSQHLSPHKYPLSSSSVISSIIVGAVLTYRLSFSTGHLPFR